MKYYRLETMGQYCGFTSVLEHDFVEQNPQYKEEYQYTFEYGDNGKFPPLADWVPIRLRPYTEGSAKRGPADFNSFEIFSSRVKDSLGHILDNYGEFYPTIVENLDDEREFYYYACNHFIDCLDYDQSEYKEDTNGLISTVRKPVFNHEKISEDTYVFVLPNQTSRGTLYVSELFKEAVQKIEPKLTGLELWEEGIGRFDYDYKPWRSNKVAPKKKSSQEKTKKLAPAKLIQSKASNSEQLFNYLIEQTQIAADNKQLDKLSKSVMSCLKESASETDYKQVLACKRKLRQFDKDFLTALNTVKEKISGSKAIKALYFEYYFDGAEDNSGNFFLCNADESESSDWASDFSDVIGDIPIYQYFAYYSDSDWECSIRFYADFLIAINMISIALKYYKQEKITLPLTFSSHDWSSGIDIG